MKFSYKGSLPLSNGVGITLAKSLGITGKLDFPERPKRQKFNIVTMR